MAKRRNVTVAISALALVLLTARFVSYFFVLVRPVHWNAWNILYLSIDVIAIIALAASIRTLQRLK